jgi:hypothetical protein
MQSNVCSFSYNFDKSKLLNEFHTRYNRGLGYRYLAGESYEDRIENEDKAKYSKTTVIRLKSGYTYNVVKKFIEEEH